MKNKSILIKIDIEGFEYEAIKGGKSLLKEQNPSIIMELHRNAIDKSDKLYDLLHEYGYQNIYSIQRKGFVTDKLLFKKLHFLKDNLHVLAIKDNNEILKKIKNNKILEDI